jgi:radical SAM protein with 4Fe4S-binding SPASM domain
LPQAYEAEYGGNVAKILNSTKCPVNYVRMDCAFKTNNRENLILNNNGNRYKHVYRCKYLKPETSNFFLYPNGDVYLCCMAGFTLTEQYKVGNLLEESYAAIYRRFAKSKRNYAICHHCDWALSIPVYEGANLLNFGRRLFGVNKGD